MRRHESFEGFDVLRTLVAVALLVALDFVAAAQIQRPNPPAGFVLEQSSPIGFLEPGWQLAPELVAGERPAEDAWRPVQLPAPFEHLLGADFDGVVWYRNDLRRGPVDWDTVPPKWRLEFQAVATMASVYWMRSLVPIEKKSTSCAMTSAIIAAAGTSTITPSGTGRWPRWPNGSRHWKAGSAGSAVPRGMQHRSWRSSP